MAFSLTVRAFKDLMSFIHLGSKQVSNSNFFSESVHSSVGARLLLLRGTNDGKAAHGEREPIRRSGAPQRRSRGRASFGGQSPLRVRKRSF